MKLKKIINTNKKYLVGCSFGPDSMALVSLLLKNNISFDIAFINYHLRDESNYEEKELLKFSKLNNIKVYKKEVYYKKEDKNVESWARNVRYDFFKEIYNLDNKNHKENYEAVLIAHNLDDLIETYLLQKERNSYVTFYGLKTLIYKDDIPYIRPLLSYRKKDLEIYCLKNNIPFNIDKSNFDNKYKRNKIRNEYIKNLSDKEIKTILLEIKYKNKKKREENNIFKKMIKNNRLNVKKCKKMDINDFINLFYYYLSYFPFLKNFSKDKINDIYLKLFLNKNIKEKIGNTLYYIFIEYGYLKIDKIYESNYYFELSKKGNKYFRFLVDTKYNEIFSNYDSIIIHPVSRDDFYSYKGQKKRVSKIFIDMKLPTSYRKIWPGVYSKNGELIYLPRYMEKVRYTKKSFLVFDIESLIKIE